MTTLTDPQRINAAFTEAADIEALTGIATGDVPGLMPDPADGGGENPHRRAFDAAIERHLPGVRVRASAVEYRSPDGRWESMVEAVVWMPPAGAMCSYEASGWADLAGQILRAFGK